MREEEARKYFQQLINTVDYCHSTGVYYRDLKPENLLLDASGDLKVLDFGLSALSHQVRDDGFCVPPAELPTMLLLRYSMIKDIMGQQQTFGRVESYSLYCLPVTCLLMTPIL